MKPIDWFFPLALALILAGGCSSNQKQTDKQEATKRWNAARAGVLSSLAKGQYEGGNLPKARQSIDEAVALAPQSAPLRILSAKIAIEQGALELAERELAVARGCDPRSAEADYLSGVVYQRWRKYEAACEFYAKASEKTPTELAYVLAHAETLVTLDRGPEALALLQGQQSNFENSAALRDAIGQLLVASGRYPEAVEALRRASVLAEDDLTIREHLGLAMFYAHDYREAGSVLSRLTKAEPFSKRSDLLTALGECQVRDGELREARATFETALQSDPANVRLWLWQANVALDLDDARRAELSLKKALALSPTDSEANLLMGYVKLRQDKLTEAIGFFRNASQADSTDPVSLCMVGYVLERTGHTREALACYVRALHLKPDDEMAKRLMAGVELRE